MKRSLTLLVVLLVSLMAFGVFAQEDVGTNPDAYIGEVVTVQGVANILSNNVVELTRTQPFDLTPASILVLPGADSEFGIDVNNGTQMQVTGTLYQFDEAGLESSLGYDLDDTAAANYDTGDYAIVASDVTRIGGPRTAMNQVGVTEFEADPTAYYNQTITVEGTANILSNNVVELINTQPYDLAPASVLVLPGPDSEFGIDVNNGQRLRVTGTFTYFDEAQLESTLGYDIDDTTAANYDTADHAIVASSIALLSQADYAAAAATLDDVIDNPDAWFGQTVTVAGYIDEDTNLAMGNFVIRDDDVLDQDRAVVLSTTDAQAAIPTGTLVETWSVGDRVTVTGTVRPFVIADLEAELGYDIDDTLYEGYEDLPAIVATSVEATAETDFTEDTLLGTEGALGDDTVGTTLGDDNVGVFDTSIYNDYPVSDASLDDVIDNPSAYYGQIVNVNGTVSELNEVGRGFFMWDDDLLDADRALVLGTSQSMWDTIGLLEADTGVAVRGVVRPFIITDLESEIGYDLDDDFYADYETEDMPAIVALEVIPNVDQ